VSVGSPDPTGFKPARSGDLAGTEGMRDILKTIKSKLEEIRKQEE